MTTENVNQFVFEWNIIGCFHYQFNVKCFLSQVRLFSGMNMAGVRFYFKYQTTKLIMRNFWSGSIKPVQKAVWKYQEQEKFFSKKWFSFIFAALCQFWSTKEIDILRHFFPFWEMRKKSEAAISFTNMYYVIPLKRDIPNQISITQQSKEKIIFYNLVTNSFCYLLFSAKKATNEI